MYHYLVCVFIIFTFVNGKLIYPRTGVGSSV